MNMEQQQHEQEKEAAGQKAKQETIMAQLQADANEEAAHLGTSQQQTQ